MPYWIHGYLKYLLDIVYNDVRKDYDAFIIMSGREGFGKSTLAMQIAKYLDPNFSVDSVVFTADQFIDAVVEGRKIKREEVLKLADGRIFTGEQAIKHRLIDRLGNLQDAISIAGKMVGIEGEPKVIYPKRGRPSILDFILQEASKSIIRTIKKMVHNRVTVYYLPAPY